jgi:hypothetical protein
LIEAAKFADAPVAVLAAHAAIEIAAWQEGHQLREEELAGVHCQVLSTGGGGKIWTMIPARREIDPAENRA